MISIAIAELPVFDDLELNSSVVKSSDLRVERVVENEPNLCELLINDILHLMLLIVLKPTHAQIGH